MLFIKDNFAKLLYKLLFFINVGFFIYSDFQTRAIGLNVLQIPKVVYLQYTYGFMILSTFTSMIAALITLSYNQIKTLPTYLYTHFIIMMISNILFFLSNDPITQSIVLMSHIIIELNVIFILTRYKVKHNSIFSIKTLDLSLKSLYMIFIYLVIVTIPLEYVFKTSLSITFFIILFVSLFNFTFVIHRLYYIYYKWNENGPRSVFFLLVSAILSVIAPVVGLNMWLYNKSMLLPSIIVVANILVSLTILKITKKRDNIKLQFLCGIVTSLYLILRGLNYDSRIMVILFLVSVILIMIKNHGGIINVTNTNKIY